MEELIIITTLCLIMYFLFVLIWLRVSLQERKKRLLISKISAWGFICISVFFLCFSIGFYLKMGYLLKIAEMSLIFAALAHCVWQIKMTKNER